MEIAALSQFTYSPKGNKSQPSWGEGGIWTGPTFAFLGKVPAFSCEISSIAIMFTHLHLKAHPPQTLILEKKSDHQSFSFLLHHQFQPPDPCSLQLLEWNSSPFNFCLAWRRYLRYFYTTSRELTSPTVSFHLQAPSNLERIHLNEANGSGTHQHHACGTKEPYMAWMHSFHSNGHLHITWSWRIQYSISPRFLESYFWHSATLWPLTTPSLWSLPGQSHAWGPKHCMPMKKTLWTCWTVALKYWNSVSS